MTTTSNNATHALDTAQVGDGATYTIYTDRLACTIVKRTPKTIYVQRDRAILQNGPNSDAKDRLRTSVGGFAAHVDGVQRYRYERDTDGSVHKFTRREIDLRDGTTRVVWKMAGTRTRSPGNVLHAGRNEYYDFNF